MAQILKQSRLGFLVLGAWLVLQGAIQLFSLSFEGLGLIMGVLAIVAGVLILLAR